MKIGLVNAMQGNGPQAKSWSAENSSNKYKSRYLLKKKSDERLSTLLESLNQSWGTSPDPNFGRR